MVQVAPSILAADFANLERDCRRVVSPQSPMLHFDVMDGNFVPNISVGAPVLKSLAKALPEAQYDVHLMIAKPLDYIQAFVDAGANAITFHIEAESTVVETARTIRMKGCKVGLSLRPGTPLEQLLPYLPEVDQVLVMSVEPGFGGQSFMPEAIPRIAALRKEAQLRGIPLCIQVDGGIDLQTAPACVKAGADVLIAGTSVFAAPNPARMIWQLQRAGEKEQV